MTMADITWPFPAGDRHYAPETFDETLEFDVELNVARSGRLTTQALPGARWKLNMGFADTTVAELPYRRELYAFLASLKGGANRLVMWNLQTPEPLGTMRGTTVLQAGAAKGDTAITLTGARGGANLLRRATTAASFLVSTQLTNATATPNSGVGPLGNNDAWTLTRTATGNHYFRHTLAGAVASRTVNARVLLKAGTLTGSVTLRLRDGADVEHGAISVTPTSSWTLFQLSATYPAGAAANAVFYVDPANDAGAAGDTLLCWVTEMDIASGVDEKCTSWREHVPPPAGVVAGANADMVVRTAAGNAYTTWVHSVASPGGRTWTLSLWLRADTYTAGVALFLRDGSGVQHGTTTVTITSQWQMFTLTATFAAGAAADVVAIVDPGDAGSVGEKYERWGVDLREAAQAGTHYPVPTLLPGDLIGINGQRVQVAALVQADLAGSAYVAFQPPLRAAVSAAAPVTLVRPTVRYVPTQPAVVMPARGSVVPGFALEFVEE